LTSSWQQPIDLPPPANAPHGPPVLEMTRPTEPSPEALAAYGADYGATKKKPAPGKGAASFSRTAVISAVVSPNPKKAGTAAHARFAKYRVGMTVEEALKAGLRSEDIRWDSGPRGYIRLS
jgi:hypothetical protein